MIGLTDLLASIEGAIRSSGNLAMCGGPARIISSSREKVFYRGDGLFTRHAEILSDTMKNYSLAPADFAKVVFYAPDARGHASIAKGLGFDKAQVQDPLYDAIGNTGTAAALIMLVAAWKGSRPATGSSLPATGTAATPDTPCGEASFRTYHERQARKKVNIDYGSYSCGGNCWKSSHRACRAARAITSNRWRMRDTISSLYGFKCRKCGTPQLHPWDKSSVCALNARRRTTSRYKFSDKTGKLFTYAIDMLQPTKNRSGLNGVIDFDGGGRMICELTDYDLEKAQVGMPSR